MPRSNYALLQEEDSVPSEGFTHHLHSSRNDHSSREEGWMDPFNDNDIAKEIMKHDGAPLSNEVDQLGDLTNRPCDGDHRTRSISSSSPSETCSPYISHTATTRGTTTKYTALQPTAVHELVYDPESLDLDLSLSYPGDEDPEDLEFYDSQVWMNIFKNTPKRFTRFHIILSGLLTAAFTVVAFGLLYVLVILPAHKGKMVSPGGKRPSADLIKLKHLGDNVAVTTCGLVMGTFENGAHVFKGIPYAAPPMGSLRWKTPVALTYESGACWQDVLNATSFGSICVQPKAFKSYNEKKDKGEEDKRKAPHNIQVWGSEDCLYLNVWTPSLNPPKLLPVLVWIHSGDFNYGSGHARGMSPTAQLAAFTKAVYISFNYRLGVFGFLALDALREDGKLPFGATGNYGIMDQQLALHWVKDNARNFGGDPNKITVFGHGSGATSIQALLLSPASTGLFSRAWLSSPVALLNKTLDEACLDNQPLVTLSGCSDSDCLRHFDTDTLIKYSPWSLDSYWTLDQLLDSPRHGQMKNDLAIFDGHVIHWDAMKHGPTGPTVPVVIGTTYSDLTGFEADVSLTNLSWNQLDTVLAPLGTEIAAQLKSQYSQLPKTAHFVQSSPIPANVKLFPLPSRQITHFVRDIQAVCPAKILADKLNILFADSAPVYLYISEAFPSHSLQLKRHLSTSPDSLPTDGVFIGWDMVAFFGSFHDFDFQERQSDISFRDIVSQEILSLARAGKPNAARWHTEGVNTGLLRSEVTVTPAPPNYFDNCDTLRHFGFFQYTWSGGKIEAKINS
ncbi:carboxylic ester hydrolase [Plakobranchus ocellatus]|uniref:Carboxylic ester hydrolase n=1 Tax=Plakobranchus ocellatus TaxID=259542 RepID=A0AAV3YEZ9_9GAST|nr:carboxylic ester hydrolase [Plakobranchus ocellatus]